LGCKSGDGDRNGVVGGVVVVVKVKDWSGNISMRACSKYRDGMA
jgi:hypothetical protein